MSDTVKWSFSATVAFVGAKGSTFCSTSLPLTAPTTRSAVRLSFSNK